EVQRMPRFCASCRMDSLVSREEVAATTKNVDLRSFDWNGRFSHEIFLARAHLFTRLVPCGATTRTDAPAASKLCILLSAGVQAPTTRQRRPVTSTNMGNSADIARNTPACVPLGSVCSSSLKKNILCADPLYITLYNVRDYSLSRVCPLKNSK